jgi:hypothetical protein
MLHQIFASKKILLLLGIQLITLATMAQTVYHARNNLQVVVSGTSTMHDWEMKTSQGECNATFTLNNSGQPTALTALSFTLPAESLKSEHSGMDKNAYKALKVSKAPNLTYTLTSATVSGNTIKCAGKLTLAGTTLNTDLVATAKINADGSITISGSKKISMNDYQIDPPSFMMGAVKTGNDVTVKFDLVLKK